MTKTTTRRWRGGDCGPAAYAAIVGCTLREATDALLDEYERAGRTQSGGCSRTAMDYALRRAGFKVPRWGVSEPVLPKAERMVHSGPGGYWGGRVSYPEYRYTLARYVREVATEGLWLITAGSSSPHYVVYRDGKCVEDNGVPRRRGRVLCAQRVTRVDGQEIPEAPTGAVGLESGGSVGAAPPEKVECAECGMKVRPGQLHYPANDPENGPAHPPRTREEEDIMDGETIIERRRAARLAWNDLFNDRLSFKERQRKGDVLTSAEAERLDELTEAERAAWEVYIAIMVEWKAKAIEAENRAWAEYRAAQQEVAEAAKPVDTTWADDAEALREEEAAESAEAYRTRQPTYFAGTRVVWTPSTGVTRLALVIKDEGEFVRVNWLGGHYIANPAHLRLS